MIDTLPPSGIFGAGSQLVASQAVVPPAAPLRMSDTPLYQGAVVLLALAYCSLLCYFRGYVASLVRLLRGKLYVEMMLEEANHAFQLFLRISIALGMVAAAIALVRIGELSGGRELVGALPDWAVMLAVPIVVAGLGIMMLYRHTLLRIVGEITLSRGFVVRFWQLRGMITALIGLLLTPLLLLTALNDGPSERWMVGALVVVLGLGMLWMLYKSWRLFLSAGSSILHWFLYLCAVEIFPLSLIVGWGLRKGF